MVGIMYHPSSSDKIFFNVKYNSRSRGRQVGSLQEREAYSTKMHEFLRYASSYHSRASQTDFVAKATQKESS